MRIILLALLALACAMPPAEAARRDERRTEASRVTQPAPARAAASRPAAARPAASRASTTPVAEPRHAATGRPTARQAPRQAAQRGDVRTQRGGTLVRGAAAATVSRAPARRAGAAGWQAGLPTASNAQRACPEGTFATLARGHDDVVRCMPL
jgi:hypothetical protein